MNKSQTSNRSLISQLTKAMLSENFILYLSIFYFVILIPFIPRIVSATNLENLFSNIWPLFAVAIGQTFVLILGGIDLSQGAIISLTSVIGTMLIAEKVDPALFEKAPIWGTILFEDGAILSKAQYGILVACVLMIVVGTLIGFINGLVVSLFQIPPFMTTLVTQMIFGATAIYIVRSENVINLPAAFVNIGTGGFGIITYALIATVLLALFSQFMLSKTVFGHWLYAIGNNLRASFISGVPTRKVTIFAYAFSGFCAGFASIFYSSRMMMGRPTLGASIQMDIIGSAVIGGSSLSGGKGKVIWTLFGVFFLQLLDNSLRLMNVPFFVNDVVKGSVILLAAMLDVTRFQLRSRNY